MSLREMHEQQKQSSPREQLQELNRQSRTELENSLLKEALAMSSENCEELMKQKLRELEESKNSFFRYEGLKLYLFWGGMVCNILVFLMLLYGMLGK